MSRFYEMQVITEIGVDNELGDLLNITFDVDFPGLACGSFGVDFMDK